MRRAVFGLELVAEGVESLVQKDMLEKIGSYLHQGSLYSHPLAKNELVRFCQTGFQYLINKERRGDFDQFGDKARC